jgi:DMSO/TMAO reductase YedYZ molybdopterin-dependent catalytic subunit
MGRELPAEPAWVHGHAHDPNLVAPPGDGSFDVRLPAGQRVHLPLSYLRSLPSTTVGQCYIVSTGHGTSGPFVFGGVRLEVLLAHLLAGASWEVLDVISADGFGTRLTPGDLQGAGQPILLAYDLDGTPLTRARGLVRLVVPSETDDALRQVKWVDRIEIQAERVK